MLNAVDFVTLALQLVFKFIDEVTLLLLPLLPFILNGLFNFPAIFRQVRQDFTFLRYSCILLGLQVGKLLIHSSVNGVELIVETLNTVIPLARQLVLEVLTASEATLVLVVLVLLFIVEVARHLISEVFQLLIVFGLVRLQ